LSVSEREKVKAHLSGSMQQRGILYEMADIIHAIKRDIGKISFLFSDQKATKLVLTNRIRYNQ
jgi:hypothetical protein